MQVLFKTPMGSRLHGLARPDSDYDQWVVVDNFGSKYNEIEHKIVGQLDTTTMDLGTFLFSAARGQPQALEAMFSEQAEVDEIASLRSAFSYQGNYNAYLGIMKKISIQHPDSFKHKRHILRLAYNMRDLRGKGRFNPTLTTGRIDLISGLAGMPMEYVYNDALALAWS